MKKQHLQQRKPPAGLCFAVKVTWYRIRYVFPLALVSQFGCNPPLTTLFPLWHLSTSPGSDRRFLPHYHSPIKLPEKVLSFTRRVRDNMHCSEIQAVCSALQYIEDYIATEPQDARKTRCSNRNNPRSPTRVSVVRGLKLVALGTPLQTLTWHLNKSKLHTHFQEPHLPGWLSGIASH